MKPYYDVDGITIYHGDCREILPSLTANALVTDPPYGIGGSSGTIGKLRAKAVYRGEWADDLDAVRSVFVPAVVAGLGVCGGRGVLTPGTPHCFEYPKPDDMGALIQPSSHGLGKWGGATWQPVLFYGRDPRLGLNIEPTAFRVTRVAPHCAHPCPKPPDTALWMVRRATVEGETILDPFTGSGMFLWAAKQIGRRAIGIEIEERYCEIAAERLSQGVLDLGGVA